MGPFLADSNVRIVVVAGEPGANVPATKKAIEDYNLSLSKRSVDPAHRGRRDWGK